jgi:hypothetical protein
MPKPRFAHAINNRYSIESEKVYFNYSLASQRLGSVGQLELLSEVLSEVLSEPSSEVLLEVPPLQDETSKQTSNKAKNLVQLNLFIFVNLLSAC